MDLHFWDSMQFAHVCILNMNYYASDYITIFIDKNQSVNPDSIQSNMHTVEFEQRVYLA